MTARGGFVLLYSLVLILIAATLTAGMLALATREAVIARRYAELGRARADAEAEARSVFGSWSTTAYRDLPPGGKRTMPGRLPHTLAGVTRLDTTLFLISAESRVSTGPGPLLTARAGLLVRALDHGAIEAFFPAAVAATASATLMGGHVSGRDACRAEAAERPGVTAPEVSAEGTDVDGDPAVQLAAPVQASPGWPLDFAAAATFADIRLELSELTPRPRARDGSCAPSASNWGAISTLHPCGDLQQIIHAPADLIIRGGEGRGILVVDGDLIMDDDFEFHGLVLVRGRVWLRRGVRIRGAVRAETVALEDAEVRMDRCAFRAALGTPVLDRAYRPGERWWVPVF